MAKRRETAGLGDFRALVEGHRDTIYHLAYRLTGNRDDAEDLVQDSLVEAFSAFARFSVATRFDRWVYRIMIHNHIDKWRRRRGRETVPLEEMESQLEASSAETPQAALEQIERGERVHRALAQLSPESRAAVVLCDGQGFSYEEAGQVLRCPVGTVRSRLHRARRQLRQWLAELDGRGGE
jgi:RNA polymerase sigma-70 factor (ECF subfamily)